MARSRCKGCLLRLYYIEISLLRYNAHLIEDVFLLLLTGVDVFVLCLRHLAEKLYTFFEFMNFIRDPGIFKKFLN